VRVKISKDQKIMSHDSFVTYNKGGNYKLIFSYCGTYIGYTWAKYYVKGTTSDIFPFPGDEK
jgi:hypothetical protein